MKKLPLPYFVVIIIILAIVALLLTTWLGIIRITDVYFFLTSAIVSWIVVVVCAILGGVFIGLVFGYRVYSTRSFTPFEEAVLEMRKEVKEIKKKVEALENKLK